MPLQYPIEEIPQNLGQILGSIQRDEPIQVLQAGRQIAVILSKQEYERLNRPASDFWTALEQFRESHDIVNADIDPDEIFANVRDRAPRREISLE